jgi:hypothetical protein
MLSLVLQSHGVRGSDAWDGAGDCVFLSLIS